MVRVNTVEITRQNYNHTVSLIAAPGFISEGGRGAASLSGLEIPQFSAPSDSPVGSIPRRKKVRLTM